MNNHFLKLNCGYHSHSLENPELVVDFIIRSQTKDYLRLCEHNQEKNKKR